MSLDEEEDLSDVGSTVNDKDAEGTRALDPDEDDQDYIKETSRSYGQSGMYNAEEVNDQMFEELVLPSELIAEVQAAWAAFLRSTDSREAAGEAIYAALFDAAPTLQNLFKTPRAVMALRFTAGLHRIINTLREPAALKVFVETLGFQHLALEVTIPRTVIFRDAIADLLSIELGAVFTPQAQEGFRILLNYVGGAYIYVRNHYASRLRILATSWATANNRKLDEDSGDGSHSSSEQGDKTEGSEPNTPSSEPLIPAKAKQDSPSHSPRSKGGKLSTLVFGSSRKNANGSRAAKHASAEDQDTVEVNTCVPTTFAEMFRFNAAVMGFATKGWMNEVLTSFDTIVLNVSNTYRLQEECDVLALRMAKHRGAVNLSEYKAVMLASLRSLVPKHWDSEHEVAWSWLWENVERLLKTLQGRPAVQEKALAALWGAFTEADQAFFRREVYLRFFQQAPTGMDYFKQSITRLHFIADKVITLTLEMYRDPTKMVTDLSALGLRHVGYGIPTELFNPFVSACVQVVRSLTTDDTAEEAFRWSLNLISRILVRVINDGSTMVMRAINANSGKQLRKAVGFAPRSKRADWVLNITVGSESISPLLWSINTGSLDAGREIIHDLLTIRADRDRYYFGVDPLFLRHPDIIRRLAVDAPALLRDLLNGLVWRSRLTEGGRRRVIYFVKHMLVDQQGQFAPAMEWLTDTEDPKLVCHPVVVLVTDLVWSKAAMRTFVFGKTWFLLTLVIFICAQSILVNIKDANGFNSTANRVPTFVCRVFVYTFSMGSLFAEHIRGFCKDYRARHFVKVRCLPIPNYLTEGRAGWSLLLAFSLLLMFATEPILHCAGKTDRVFAQICSDSRHVAPAYRVFSMCALLCYYLLLTDLSVFSTQVSAFVLVIGRVLAEVRLFLFAWAFLVLVFASGISSLDQADPNFIDLPTSARSLVKITLGMFGGANFMALDDNHVLQLIVLAYGIVTVVFLLNLLVAQLNCAYGVTYQDMVGLARLKRGKVVVEAMRQVPLKRWEAFVVSLKLDQPCEFGEGDIGLAGGIQMTEPSNANITTVEMIKRVGGSTSPAAPWPEEETSGDCMEDRFEKVERIIMKTMKRVEKRGAGGGSMSGIGSSVKNSSADGASSGGYSDGGDI